MDNYPQFWKDKQLNIIVPATILSHTQLSFNQKLILGLDYSFKQKLGYNSMTNKDVGQLLNLHPNIVSYCRKHLINKGFLKKDGKKYTITQKHTEFEVGDMRNIILPYVIYSSKDIITGTKLLWGEYNSISKGKKEYFASREYTSRRLNVSVESITNWTRQLFDNKLLSSYIHKYGYSKSQKVIVTADLKTEFKRIRLL